MGITFDTYSHVAPHMQSDAAEKIDAGLPAAVAGYGRSCHGETEMAQTRSSEPLTEDSGFRQVRLGRLPHGPCCGPRCTSKSCRLRTLRPPWRCPPRQSWRGSGRSPSPPRSVGAGHRQTRISRRTRYCRVFMQASRSLHSWFVSCHCGIGHCRWLPVGSRPCVTTSRFRHPCRRSPGYHRA